MLRVLRVEEEEAAASAEPGSVDTGMSDRLGSTPKIFCRIWRWTAAPGRPGGLSLPHGPVPAPPTTYVFTR